MVESEVFEMKYYVAYGSNLNVQQMKFRCPTAKIVGTSEIHGYQLLFKGSKTGSYLTVEKAKNGIVPVAVWAVTNEDERSLDRYEGFPNFFYKKELELPVKLANGKIKTLMTFVYVMHEERSIGIPSAAYLHACSEGYRSFGFDLGILIEAIHQSKEELENEN